MAHHTVAAITLFAIAISSAKGDGTPEHGCRIGFDLVGEKCLFLVHDLKTYDDAKEDCEKKYMAQMLTTKTEEEYTNLMTWDKIVGHPEDWDIWIGLHNKDINDVEDFVWDDGRNTRLVDTWSSWARGFPSRRAHTCVAARRASSTGWMNYGCTSATNRFASVCQQQEWISNSVNGYEYKVLRNKYKIHDAVTQCAALDAVVVTPTDLQENTFVRSLSTTAWIWLGITDEDVEGQWKYFEGGELTWTNWRKGEPNKGSSENYAAMASPQVKFGGPLWVDTHGRHSHTAICQRKTSIDGGVGPWSQWGTCSATCGGGTMTRVRDCDNPTPQYGGADCSETLSETSDCNVDACPPERVPARAPERSPEIQLDPSSDTASNNGVCSEQPGDHTYHADSNQKCKYYQCEHIYIAHHRDCAPGTKWSQAAKTCVRLDTDETCD